MKNRDPLLKFDPRTLARYERDNYVAYYQKAWLKLIRASIGMVKEAFGLNILQAVYGAYLIARAEIAFAPFPENDLPKTRAYLGRFFEFIQGVHHLDLDIEKAVQAEIHWWQVHRQCFGKEDNQELVDALVQAYQVEYGVEPSQVIQPAFHRAQGMLLSDLWVNGGKDPNSPLLKKEEEELTLGYQLLCDALA